jgi:RimJ/RimL family protein N-acetyltransferase
MKELQTPRLRLEPLKERHARILCNGLGDELLYEFLVNWSPESLGSLWEKWGRLACRPSLDGHRALLTWALRLRSPKLYVGYVQATLYLEGRAKVAYVLFQNAWGNGYVREAANALIDPLDTSSLRSIRLLEAYGSSVGQCA